MTVLFGHPSGNPNSHHAALAHFEAGCLEAICIPWMPSSSTISLLKRFRGVRKSVDRLERRHFSPLALAPKVQGRLGEWGRMARRAAGLGDEGLSYQANDWLMHTMVRECRRSAVKAVHAFEDCSQLQFEEAKRLDKACIYDLPIGFYPAWESTLAELEKTYAEWLPVGGLPASRHVRPRQKLREMELADLVLVPSSFVEGTVLAHAPTKRIARAAYGVDLEFWQPAVEPRQGRPLRFLYAGQISLRKGIPLLLDAWEKANLGDAELELVGVWQLADSKLAQLPANVSVLPPQSREGLRERYRQAEAFVFPSYFEGFGLVLLEAMACGLPALASDATAGPDVLTERSGRVVPRGAIEPLVEALRWFEQSRDLLPKMSAAARLEAERWTWESYRSSVTRAVETIL